MGHSDELAQVFGLNVVIKAIVQFIRCTSFKLAGCIEESDARDNFLGNCIKSQQQQLDV